MATITRYAHYPITDSNEFVREAVLAPKEGSRFRDWLLSPIDLDATFFRSLAAWRASLAQCEPGKAATPPLPPQNTDPTLT